MASIPCPRRISLAAAALCVGLPLAAQSNVRVSVDPLGGPSPSGSANHALSGDGAVVAFSSISELVAGDANAAYDVYVHDRAAGTTVCANVSSTGEVGNDLSESPAVDPRGRYVAFISMADNLIPGDTNGVQDVFLHDLALGTTERVNVLASGGQPGTGAGSPSLSVNAERVAFLSSATGLVQGGTNGKTNVFVRDRVLGVNVLASVDSNGVGGDDNCYQAQISADGSVVAFDTKSTNLTPGDTNGEWDVFVHDLGTGQTVCVSLTPSGVPGNSLSTLGGISADGRLVTFTSYADDLVPGDTNGVGDIFVHDLQTGQTTRVSVSSAGVEGDAESRAPSLSGDGRYVAFESRAKTLVAGAAGPHFQVYVHDLQTGTTTRESVNAAGQNGQLESRRPLLDHEGRFMAFWSWSANLAKGDTNGAPDTFLRDRFGCTPSVVTYCQASTTSLPGCEAQVAATGQPSLSAPASFRVSSGAIPGGVVGVAFFGIQGASLTPIGTQGGLLCVGGTRYAAVPRASQGTPGQCDGALEYGLDEWIAVQPDLLGPGAVVHASFWFRDPGSTDGYGLSDGVWFQVCP